MKKIINPTLFGIIIVLCASIVVPLSAKTALGTVSEIIGSALIKRDGDSTWTKLRLKSPVFEKDAISTKAESRCEIKMTGDKVVRMDENSIIMLSARDTVSSKVSAVKGALWVNVKHLANSGRQFQVSTVTAVASIRGTVFGTDCNSNASKYFVLNGEIAVTSGPKGHDSTFTVKKGQQIDLVKDMNLYIEEQGKAIAKYMEEDSSAFEKFQTEEQADFDKDQKEMQDKINAMLDEERKAFTEINGINCAIRALDEAKLGKSDWAAWNRKLDEKTGW